MDKPYKKFEGFKDVNELRHLLEVSSKNVKQIKALLDKYGNRIDMLEKDIASINATLNEHGRKLDLIVQLLSQNNTKGTSSIQ